MFVLAFLGLTHYCVYSIGRESRQAPLLSYRFILLPDEYRHLAGGRIVTNRELDVDTLLYKRILAEYRNDRRRELVILKGY
jgi:hypothetical protein